MLFIILSGTLSKVSKLLNFILMQSVPIFAVYLTCWFVNVIIFLLISVPEASIPKHIVWDVWLVFDLIEGLFTFFSPSLALNQLQFGEQISLSRSSRCCSYTLLWPLKISVSLIRRNFLWFLHPWKLVDCGVLWS